MSGCTYHLHIHQAEKRGGRTNRAYTSPSFSLGRLSFYVFMLPSRRLPPPAFLSSVIIWSFRTAASGPKDFCFLTSKSIYMELAGHKGGNTLNIYYLDGRREIGMGKMKFLVACLYQAGYNPQARIYTYNFYSSYTQPRQNPFQSVLPICSLDYF